MTAHLPADDDVRLAMHQVLAEAATSRRHATITAVERQLDITHPTFYRNYPHLISWFKAQASAQQPAQLAAASTSTSTSADSTLARLRRENEDLRRTVNIYAEAIRQLTVDNDNLASELETQAAIPRLDSHRAPRLASHLTDS
jgi:predicted Zn-dependent peptidase